MTAIDAIRLSTMLVLSALLAVLVIAGLFAGAESAAGVAHSAAHRATATHRTVAATRSGAAWAQSVGRRKAQRQRAWGVVRGQAPRAIRIGMGSTSSRG